MWKDSARKFIAPKPRKWRRLRWSGAFFAMAILAAIFGFMDFSPGGVAGVAKVLFFLFLVIFVVSAGIGLVSE
jgi:uncharacterized membrane protein YtjA (UPF0391 family)